MEDCIFCKIINKEVPTKILFESNTVVAFPDINPAADVHILIVPREHLHSVQDVQDNGQLLSDIYSVANELAEKHNLKEDFYRIVVNAGRAQQIPHLHFHLLGGEWKNRI